MYFEYFSVLTSIFTFFLAINGRGLTRIREWSLLIAIVIANITVYAIYIQR